MPLRQFSAAVRQSEVGGGADQAPMAAVGQAAEGGRQPQQGDILGQGRE